MSAPTAYLWPAAFALTAALATHALVDGRTGTSTVQVAVDARDLAGPVDDALVRAQPRDDVLIRAAYLLGAVDPDAAELRRLRDSTTVSTSFGPDDGGRLVVGARGRTPAVADQRARAVAQALALWLRQQAAADLQTELVAVEERVRTLQAVGGADAQQRAQALLAERSELQDRSAQLLTAEPPAPQLLATELDEPRPLLAALAAATIVIVGAFSVPLARRAGGARVTDTRTVAAGVRLAGGRMAGLPVLARFVGGPFEGDANAAVARRMLVTSILATARGRDRLVVAVTDTGGGTVDVAAALAEELAASGYRTLLVDADLASPSCATRYGIEERYLEVGGGDGEPLVSSTLQWLEDPRGRHHVRSLPLRSGAVLDVVPQFRSPPDPQRSLERGLGAALERWSGYEAVVLATAPLPDAREAATVARHADLVVLVADARSSRRATMTAARRTLRIAARGVSVGVVAVHADAEGLPAEPPPAARGANPAPR